MQQQAMIHRSATEHPAGLNGLISNSVYHIPGKGHQAARWWEGLHWWKLIGLVLLSLLLLSGLGVRAADNKGVDRAVPVSGWTPLSADEIAHMTREQKEARAAEIKARVKEIQEMDKSTLSREERKELKAELKSMKKEARVISGIYISVGALIIIILLLIIIL